MKIIHTKQTNKTPQHIRELRFVALFALPTPIAPPSFHSLFSIAPRVCFRLRRCSTQETGACAGGRKRKRKVVFPFQFWSAHTTHPKRTNKSAVKTHNTVHRIPKCEMTHKCQHTKNNGKSKKRCHTKQTKPRKDGRNMQPTYSMKLRYVGLTFLFPLTHNMCGHHCCVCCLFLAAAAREALFSSLLNPKPTQKQHSSNSRKRKRAPSHSQQISDENLQNTNKSSDLINSVRFSRTCFVVSLVLLRHSNIELEC